MIDTILDAVGTKNARLLPVLKLTELLSFGEKTATGEPAKPPRNDGSLHLDAMSFAGLRHEANAALAVAIPGHLIALAIDGEPGFPAQHFGKVEGNQSSIIGNET